MNKIKMSKLMVNLVVAKLSELGYEVIDSTYTLERVYKGEMLNCKIAYFLKDANHKTGQVTFTDGRKSFKNGLALDITITDEKDLDRPIKVYSDKTYVKLLRIDYEKEKQNEIKFLKEENKQNKKITEKLVELNTQIQVLTNLVNLINGRTTEMRNKQIEYTKKIMDFIIKCVFADFIFIVILLLLVLFLK